MNIIFSSPMNTSRMHVTGKKGLFHIVIFVLHGQEGGSNPVHSRLERT